MNTDPNFANNLFEKLVNLTKKNTEIKNNTPAASKSLKSTSSSSSSPNGTKSTKGGENKPIPGTPQVVDTKPTKELKHSEPGKSTQSQVKAQSQVKTQLLSLLRKPTLLIITISRLVC